MKFDRACISRAAGEIKKLIESKNIMSPSNFAELRGSRLTIGYHECIEIDYVRSEFNNTAYIIIYVCGDRHIPLAVCVSEDESYSRIVVNCASSLTDYMHVSTDFYGNTLHSKKHEPADMHWIKEELGRLSKL
jgi:hypothetical protein